MSRCGVCDYTAEHGSQLLDTPPNPNIKVRWHEKYKGFLCNACIVEIGLAIDDWKEKEDLEYNQYFGPKY